MSTVIAYCFAAAGGYMLFAGIYEGFKSNPLKDTPHEAAAAPGYGHAVAWIVGGVLIAGVSLDVAITGGAHVLALIQP